MYVQGKQAKRNVKDNLAIEHVIRGLKQKDWKIPLHQIDFSIMSFHT